MRRGRPKRDYDAEADAAQVILDAYNKAVLKSLESDEDFDVEDYFNALTVERPALARRTTSEVAE